MKRLALFLAVGVISIAGVPAMAELVTFDAGDVWIEFDSDSFAFTLDDGFFGTINIPPNELAYMGFANGVTVGMNDRMILSDFATGESDPVVPVTGSLNAGFSFIPKPGFTIHGYNVSYAGLYEVETPGSAGVSLQGIGSSLYSNSGFNQPFHEAFYVPGAIAPALQGSVEALGQVDFIQVQVGTEWVQVGVEYIPDPSCTDPDPSNCPLIEVPIYEEVPVYEYQADLGLGGINLQNVRIAAVVTGPCDLNADGTYDAADAGIMFSNWGQPGLGDCNADGIVDAGDAGQLFSLWTGDSVPVHSVPEPTGAILGALGILIVSRLRRR